MSTYKATVHGAKLYKLNENVVMFNRLFLKGDNLYIQNYDPINGTKQQVFLMNRENIGEISSSFWHELERNMTKVENL